MTRLWDKGLPLSERVLRYTAGEDHVLDARLVPYDVRGSIAHAEMLAATGLIGDEDASAIRDGLKQLEASFEGMRTSTQRSRPGSPVQSATPAHACISVAPATTRF
jgi:argininosuccinate lyase